MKFNIQDISFTNKEFWGYYLSYSYPNAYCKILDIGMADLVQKMLPIDCDWYNEFVHYYNGVLDEVDGYVDNPTTLEVTIASSKILLIEFHPGDTLYFINGDKIGSTGPHWELQKISYEKIKAVLNEVNGAILFQLLLPMVILAEKEESSLAAILEVHFSELGFTQPELLQTIACLISGIKESIYM